MAGGWKKNAGIDEGHGRWYVLENERERWKWGMQDEKWKEKFFRMEELGIWKFEKYRWMWRGNDMEDGGLMIRRWIDEMDG